MLVYTRVARASLRNTCSLYCCSRFFSLHPCILAPISGQARRRIADSSPATLNYELLHASTRAYSTKKKEKGKKKEEKNKKKKMDNIKGVRIAVEGCVCYHTEPITWMLNGNLLTHLDRRVTVRWTQFTPRSLPLAKQKVGMA